MKLNVQLDDSDMWDVSLAVVTALLCISEGVHPPGSECSEIILTVCWTRNDTEREL
jgi:hypothetical protein